MKDTQLDAMDQQLLQQLFPLDMMSATPTPTASTAASTSFPRLQWLAVLLALIITVMCWPYLTFIDNKQGKHAIQISIGFLVFYLCDWLFRG